jgi:hypothetical protein
MPICRNARAPSSPLARWALAVVGLGFVVVAPVPAAAAELPIDGPDVFIGATGPDGYGQLPPTVAPLAARSVLHLTITGFEPESTGVMEQCSVGGCANPFPVTFDLNGRARVQYLVRDDFASGFDTPSRCRAGEPACVVHIHSGEQFAFLSTVFRDPAPPPPSVTVEPNRDELVDGARVTVAVTGFTPGDRVQAMFCVAPATYGSERCGTPGPVSTFTIGAGGEGRTTLGVREGRVGSEGASCGGASQCGIVVTHPESVVPEAFVTVSFAEGPVAQYDLTRSIAGLSLAVVLFTLAWLLVRSTDWRKPTEADTPELDQAEFTDD